MENLQGIETLGLTQERERLETTPRLELTTLESRQCEPRAQRIRKLHLKTLFVLLLTLLGSSLAQQNVLKSGYQGERVTFEGTRNIRFYADYAKGTLLLPDATLADLSVYFPHDFIVTVREDSLSIDVGGPFRAVLSPDEHTLTVVRGEPLGAAPEQVGGDERAPVMYYLSSAEPSDVASLMKSMYPDLRVEVDARQRALLVMVNPDDRTLIDALVSRLDAARPQVMFEAEILEINQDVTQSLGINYDSIFTFNLTEGLPSGVFSMGPVSRGPLSLTFGLNVLKTNGAAEVLARPRVTTLDGVEAQLNATQTVPVVVPGNNGRESIQNITTGIKLTLLPKISPDGTVEADLAISVSTPTGTTSQGVPQFSSRDASTTVRVANGQPIAIGGLLEKRTIKGTQKVPILGDIPIIGALFTSTRTEKRETDLVIIVTPRIVDMPGLPSLAPSPPVLEPVPQEGN